MRRFHGFSAQNVVASWTEPNTMGDFRDFNAPRNAPAKTPLAHLDKIAFHSSFYLYEKAIDRTVTVNHAAVATKSVYDGFTRGSLRPLGIEWQGNQLETSRTLLSHGLGYTPLVLVAYSGRVIVGGTIVQTSSAGTRFVSVYADNSVVGLGECAYANDANLPAVSRSYRVVVFRTPAPNPAKYQFSGNGDQFQIGRGVIDSSKSYLRRVTTSASDLDMDFGRTVDIKNGGARIVTGGNVQTDQFYNGSFTGGGFLPVDV